MNNSIGDAYKVITACPVLAIISLWRKEVKILRSRLMIALAIVAMLVAIVPVASATNIRTGGGFTPVVTPGPSSCVLQEGFTPNDSNAGFVCSISLPRGTLQLSGMTTVLNQGSQAVQVHAYIQAVNVSPTTPRVAEAACTVAPHTQCPISLAADVSSSAPVAFDLYVITFPSNASVLVYGLNTTGNAPYTQLNGLRAKD